MVNAQNHNSKLSILANYVIKCKCKCRMHYIVVLPNDATNLTIFFFVFLFILLLFCIHLLCLSLALLSTCAIIIHPLSPSHSLSEKIGKRSNNVEIRSCGNQTSIRAASTQSSNRESSMTFGIFLFAGFLFVSIHFAVFALVYFPCQLKFKRKQIFCSVLNLFIIFFLRCRFSLCDFFRCCCCCLAIAETMRKIQT